MRDSREVGRPGVALVFSQRNDLAGSGRLRSGDPSVRRPPAARLRRRREGARDRVLPGSDAPARPRRRALAAPVPHPQGRGPPRARGADAPGPRGGRDLRLHLPHLREGDPRRDGRGGPPRLPAPEEAVRGAPRARPVRRPLRLRARRAAPEQPRALAGGELPAGPRRPGRRRCSAARRCASRATRAWARRRGSWRTTRSRRCSSTPTRPASSPTATSAAGSSPPGRGPETPVREVQSSPLKTVSAECPIYEAWRILLDAGVPPPAGRARRGDRRRPHGDRPPQVHRRRPGRGDEAGRAARRARRPPRLLGEGRGDGLRPLQRRPRADRHRRLRRAAQRHARQPHPALGRGRPRPAADSLRVARLRLRGADGADGPHGSGQRARLGGGRRPERASTSARSPRRRSPTSSRRVPALPGRLHGHELARRDRRLGGALPRLARAADAPGAARGVDLLRLPGGARPPRRHAPARGRGARRRRAHVPLGHGEERGDLPAARAASACGCGASRPSST